MAEPLAALDPSNTEWQRDLLMSNVGLAQMVEGQGDAAARYRRALDVAERLAADGRLAPADAGIPDELRRRLRELDG